MKTWAIIIMVMSDEWDRLSVSWNWA